MLIPKIVKASLMANYQKAQTTKGLLNIYESIKGNQKCPKAFRAQANLKHWPTGGQQALRGQAAL